MSVHYKFKSSTDYDTVTFDGLHISVGDLKKAILQQKKIGKSADFDLQITNAQTKEDYSADNDLVPKNTSIIVARVPIANPVKKSWERNDANSLMQGNDSPSHVAYDKLSKTADLVNANATEEEKIKAMMTQSGQEYEPSKFVKNRSMSGPLPPNYVCYRCGKSGHWIKSCPTNSSSSNVEIKRSTGIPRSFMVTVNGPEIKGALLTSTGDFAVPLIDQQAYKEIKKEKPPFLKEAEVPAEPEPQLPEELLCMVCKDLLQDAVLIPCCGNSFCDECARQVLLDSEVHECPSCHEIDISPDNLIPNRYLRTAVSNFRNKTGYTRARKMAYMDMPAPTPVVKPVTVVPVEPRETPRPEPRIEVKSEVGPAVTAVTDVPDPVLNARNEELHADVAKLELDVTDGKAEDALGESKADDKTGDSGEVRTPTPLADEPSVDYKPRYEEDSRRHHHSSRSQDFGGRHSHDYYQDSTETSEPSTISTITTRLASWNPTRRQQPWNSSYSNQSYESSSRRDSGRDSRDYGSYRSSSSDYNRRGYNNRNYQSSGYRYSSRGAGSRGYSRYPSPPPAMSRYVSPPPSHHRSSHSVLPPQASPVTSLPPPEKPVVSYPEHTVFHSEPPPPGTDLHGQPPMSIATPHRSDHRHEEPHREPLLRSPPPSHQQPQHREPPPPGVGPLMPLPPPQAPPTVQTSHPPPPTTVVPPPVVTAPPPLAPSSGSMGTYPDNYSRHLEVYRQSNLYHDSRRNKDKKWSKDPMDDFARELMEFKREHRPLTPRRSRSRSYHSSKSWSHSRSRSYSRSVSRSRTRSRSHSYSSRSRSRTFSRSRSRSRTPARSFTRSRSHSRGSIHSGSRSPRRKYRSPPPRYYHRSRSRTPPKHYRSSIPKPFHKRPELPIAPSHPLPIPSTYYSGPSYIPSYNASVPPPNPPPIEPYNPDRGYYDHYHMGYDNFPPHSSDSRRYNQAPHLPPVDSHYPPPHPHLDKYIDARKFHPRVISRRTIFMRKDERPSGSSRTGEGSSSYGSSDKYKERAEIPTISTNRKEEKSSKQDALSSKSHKHSSKESKKGVEVSDTRRARTKKEEAPKAAPIVVTVSAGTVKDSKGKKTSKSEKHSKEHKHRHKKAKDGEEHKKKKKKPSSDETSQVTGSESEKPKKKKRKKIVTEKLKQIVETDEPKQPKISPPVSPVKEIPVVPVDVKNQPIFEELELPEHPVKEEKIEAESSPVSEEPEEPETPQPEEKSMEPEEEGPISAEIEEPASEGDPVSGQEYTEIKDEMASVHNESLSGDEPQADSGEESDAAEDPANDSVLQLPLPELSKWERDDSEEAESDQEPTSPSHKKGDGEDMAKTPLSSDILQKAENAILGKAPKLQVISEGQAVRSKPGGHVEKSPETHVEDKAEPALQEKSETISRSSRSSSPRKKEDSHTSASQRKESERPDRRVLMRTDRSSGETRSIRMQNSRQNVEPKTHSRDWDRPNSRNSTGSRHDSSGSRRRSASRPRSIHIRSLDRSERSEKREVRLRSNEKSRYGSHSRTIRINPNTSRKQGNDGEVSSSKPPSKQRKPSRDHAHDESSFEPNYDETSDSDASATSNKDRSKVLRRRVSIKNEPLPGKHGRTKIASSEASSKSKNADSDKHYSKSSSESSKVDRVKKNIQEAPESGKTVLSKKRPRVEPSKERKAKSDSVSSSSSASESETSEAEENPKKKARSESSEKDERHHQKRPKHKKHRKHKHKHKKRKNAKKEKDEVRVMSSVVRR